MQIYVCVVILNKNNFIYIHYTIFYMIRVIVFVFIIIFIIANIIILKFFMKNLFHVYWTRKFFFKLNLRQI